jgi:hypothetical protein
MNLRRMALCTAVALVAMLALGLEAMATTFSVRVFDANTGAQITTDAVTITVTDSANNVLASQITQSGAFSFTVTSMQSPDKSLTFSFNRGTNTVIIAGIAAQTTTPTLKMDVVVAK